MDNTRPDLTREEIIKFLFSAHSLELIELGRRAYARWGELYGETEPESLDAESVQLTAVVLDSVARRERVLRRLLEQGKNPEETLGGFQANANRIVVSQMALMYPGQEAELAEGLNREQEEEKQRQKSVETRIRHFLSECA